MANADLHFFDRHCKLPGPRLLEAPGLLNPFGQEQREPKRACIDFCAAKAGKPTGSARPLSSRKGAVMPEDSPGFQASQTEWDRIANTRDFKDLMATKKIFIIPAFVFFVAYYFALPILVGYAPHFMDTKVFRTVNLAYLFALSQFFMAWTVAWLYLKAAENFDRLAKDIIEKARGEIENHKEAGEPCPRP